MSSPEQALAEVQSPGAGRASMTDTIRNHRLVDDPLRQREATQRDIARLDFSHTCRIPRMDRAIGRGRASAARRIIHASRCADLSVELGPVTRWPVRRLASSGPHRDGSTSLTTSALWTSRVLLRSAAVGRACRNLAGQKE